MSGVTKPIISIKKNGIYSISRGVLLYHTIFKDLDQLIDGLKLHNVINLIREAPEKMEFSFVHSNKFEIDSEKFKNISSIKYSAIGSTRRQDAIRNFFKCVDDMGNGLIGEFMIPT